MGKPQTANEVSIGIACPNYGDGAKSFAALKATYMKDNEFDRGYHRWNWIFKETFITLHLREDGRKDGRTRYNKHLICPHCQAELLLCIDNRLVSMSGTVNSFNKVILYQFSENAVAHHLHYMGYKSNRLYLDATGTVVKASMQNRTPSAWAIDASRIPMGYLPEHPEIFSDDWKIKNPQIIGRLEDLSDEEIAIFMAADPRQAVALLNDAKTGMEIAQKALNLAGHEHKYDVEKLRPIPETLELLSAIVPFIDQRSKTNLTTGLLFAYSSLCRKLFWQTVIIGVCFFIIPLTLRIFIAYPFNMVFSMLVLIVTVTGGFLYFHGSLDEAKPWQEIVTWLPENKHIKYAKICRLISILVQVTFLIISCYTIIKR
jgi:hypothetical protein